MVFMTRLDAPYVPTPALYPTSAQSIPTGSYREAYFDDFCLDQHLTVDDLANGIEILLDPLEVSLDALTTSYRSAGSG